MRVGIQVIEAKSLRELMALEPRAIFEQVALPMLLVAGSKDVQCDPADAAAIAALSERTDAHLIQDLTHVLRRDAGSSGMQGYGKLASKPVEPELLTLIESWLVQRGHNASRTVTGA